MLTRTGKLIYEVGVVVGRLTTYDTGNSRVPKGWRIDWTLDGWEPNQGSAETARRALEQVEHVIELHNLY